MSLFPHHPHLPPEIESIIFNNHLDMGDRQMCRLVCKRWNDAIPYCGRAHIEECYHLWIAHPLRLPVLKYLAYWDLINVGCREDAFSFFVGGLASQPTLKWYLDTFKDKYSINVLLFGLCYIPSKSRTKEIQELALYIHRRLY